MSEIQVERDGRHGPQSVIGIGKTKVIVELLRDGPDGKPRVLKRVESHNTVVNSGKFQAMRLLVGATSKVYDQIRIGTSGAAVVSNQTNVLSPVAGTLTTVDSTGFSGATRTYSWVHSYPSGGGSISATDIQEVCILREGTSPGGSAWNRSTFTAVTKTTADKLKITYKARIT